MKISQNLGVMYGQNFKIFSKYVWITAGMHVKGQILLGWPIRPQKKLNLFGPANQAFKNGNFVQIGLKKWWFCSQMANHKGYIIPNHSASVPSVSRAPPRLFLRAAIIALTTLKIS